MTEPETWQEQYDALDEDLRAETVLLMLDRHADGRVHTLFYLNGGFKRIFRKDVARLVPPGHHKFNNASPIIEAHRRGLYDLFPEFFFHQSKSNKHFKSVTDLKSEREHHLEIEKEARKFFWPLDDQLVQAKSGILDFELSMGQRGQAARHDYLRRFWSIPDCFDDRQARLLTMVLPIASEVSASIDWMEDVFSLVLQLPVTIVKELRNVERAMVSGPFQLGKSQLGMSTVAGASYAEELYTLTFAVGPVSMADANTLSQSGVRQPQIAYLMEHLVPIDMETRIEVVPKPDFSFTLFEKHELCSILGVSSILSSD